MKIGTHQLASNIILAPMAGVSDRPFREIAHEFGIGLAVSEMVSSNPLLRHTRKSRLRRDHRGETGIRAVQIVGTDPQQMAEAAVNNVEQGAQIIDINMGCPAKKVCSKLAGSALLRDERLVDEILNQVVNAVDVPVTLKVRTGWSPQEKNGVTIAKIAEDAGIQALTIHGRTRACAFRGEVEYETIARIKQTVTIPVIANGDIDSPQKALSVMQQTGADGLMIGRAARGNPWLLERVSHYLEQGGLLPKPTLPAFRDVMLRHLRKMHEFYGELAGLRIARKHLGWYCMHLPQGRQLRSRLIHTECAQQQFDLICQYFENNDGIRTGLAA